VGREEEGSSSNQPELAAFLLALRGTLIEEPLLYLCDNHSLIRGLVNLERQRWGPIKQFTWEKPCREVGKVTYQDRYSTFNNSVRDAIRREAAENKVQRYEAREAYRCLETNVHTQETI